MDEEKFRMRVRVLYFGVLKEKLGRSDEVMEVAAGSCAGDLMRRVEAGAGGLTGLWKSVAVAVNREYAAAETVLHEGDEVALLPPVSGGSGAR